MASAGELWNLKLIKPCKAFSKHYVLASFLYHVSSYPSSNLAQEPLKKMYEWTNYCNLLCLYQHCRGAKQLKLETLAQPMFI